MAEILRVHARQVLDSRGKPTVEVEVHATCGSRGRALVPSGASTGSAEALELRDGDPRCYDGQSVLQAVRNVNEILAPPLLGMPVVEQQQIDRRLLELDGTPRKTQLGANALLGVSLAAAHAAAASSDLPLHQHIGRLYVDAEAQAGRQEAEAQCASGQNAGSEARPPCPAPPRMPMPMTNMISGGLHAGGNLDFQDVLVLPVGAPDYRVGLEWIVRVYRRLQRLLADDGFESSLVGDEGGFGPRLPTNRLAVEFVVCAIEAAGLRPGQDVTIAIDVAATHFREQNGYRLASENNIRLTTEQLIDRLQEWVDQFPIVSIEDGLAEDDWEGWSQLTRRLGERVQLVGDDLFATNAQRVLHGATCGAANSALIKVNQIGTLTETLETIRAARESAMSIVVSARSGETEDATISDLAVGVAAEQIKIGSIVRGERLAKYNQLLRIQEQLEQDGADCRFDAAQRLRR